MLFEFCSDLYVNRGVPLLEGLLELSAQVVKHALRLFLKRRRQLGLDIRYDLLLVDRKHVILHLVQDVGSCLNYLTFQGDEFGVGLRGQDAEGLLILRNLLTHFRNQLLLSFMTGFHAPFQGFLHDFNYFALAARLLSDFDWSLLDADIAQVDEVVLLLLRLLHRATHRCIVDN